MQNKIKIGELCEIINGFPFESEKYVESGIRIIRIANVQKGYLVDNSPVYYPLKSEGIQKFMLKKDDLLMSLTGNVGRVAIITEAFLPAALNQRVACLRLKSDKVQKRFLYHFLNSNAFEQSCVFNSKGMAQKNMSTEWLKNFEIPIYSKTEQEKISCLFDRILKIIELKNQQLSALDILIKSQFIEMFGDPEINPKKFPVKHMSEIAKYWNGLTFKPEDVSSTGIIILRSNNIQNMQLNFNDTIRVNCKIGSNKFVKNNDILMCSRNGSAKLVGKVALVKNLCEPMSFGAFMMIIRSDFYPYLMTYFQMPSFRSQISIGATTTINQITGKMMNNIMLPVPDINTVIKYDNFVRKVDELKQTIQRSINKTQVLFDSLAQRYFG